MQRLSIVTGLVLLHALAAPLLAQRGGGGGRGAGQGGQPGPNRNVLVVPGERHGTSVFPLANYPEVKPLVPGQIDWQHYHTSAEIEEFMRKWAQQYPDLVELYTVGKSFGGRDIWQMTLTNKRTGAHTDKPAAFFEGGRHSGEISATESAFYLMWYLLENYAKDAAIKQLLDTKAIYIKPLNNPDGSDMYRLTAQSNRSSVRPQDNDGDGLLDEDPGEDLDGDGKITRYILPAPPITPKVKVIPDNQKATVYWDSRAEFSVDPISGKQDFEGYKLYRTQAGFDLTQQQDLLKAMVVAASFDSAGNDIEFDTGFEFVRLSSPGSFPGDTTEYYYKFEFDNLLNGWQYLFAVTAFDQGDPENDLDILESSPLANFERIIPGTPPVEDPDVQIGVYPNPYYGNAIWDGSSERLRKIYFFNLSSDCEITIYTLAGDVVKRIQHSSQSTSSEIRWFETYASDNKQKFAGGEHAWDLLTDNEQAIATGLYVFTVKNNRNGEIKTGKFLIIK